MIADVKLESLSKKAEPEILKELLTSREGLSHKEAAKRQKEFGPNEFGARAKISPVRIFLSKFKNPILLILIAAAAVSWFFSSRIDSLVIIAIVVGSVFIDFLNTYKSAAAAEKLKERVNITIAVCRGGEFRERPIGEMVPGDIFSLEAGDIVPADAILLESRDLFVNESALTGESLPAEKDAANRSLRAVFMGTSVVSGKATAIAAVTGAHTKIGGIAERLREPEIQTEFEKNLKDFSIFIFRITLLLVLAIIFFNVVFEAKPSFEVFLFAVAIAVGLTPELLPLIVTANLAKGAIAMSKKGVIVKKLSAIHNFGSIDVLCTDKTGTLTEDKITLVKYVDGLGSESKDVLFWGYLSSSFLTSVRGTLDQAMREGGKAEGEKALKGIDIAGWKKFDEIPFDFERRSESVVVSPVRSLARAGGASPSDIGEAASNGMEHEAGHAVLISKGAPEGILRFSKYYGEKKEPLHERLRGEIEAQYAKLSSDGFRVLGVAVKNVLERKEYSKDDETEMTFLGFLAFLDPPKRTVKSTLEKMASYNVGVKIITGDNDLVTEKIARDLNVKITGRLTGEEIGRMHEAELREKVETANMFTRVAPEEKELIIRLLRKNGHVVGYMGDGVNDALSLKEADVGISVNNAVDVAKESADIILLRKGLGEILEGVLEGRKTFANTFKYLMMALSSNFGNMFSMPAASLFLPFLPMTPSQILLNNFMYDSSQLTIPLDNVDDSFLRRPKKFDLRFMKNFMLIFGPLSSCFDLITFVALYYVLRLAGGAFQTGWFLESIATQTLVVNVIRSRKNFLESMPGRYLIAGTVLVVILGWVLPFTLIGPLFGFAALAGRTLAVIAAIVLAYLFAVEFAKRKFYARYGHLIER